MWNVDVNTMVLHQHPPPLLWNSLTKSWCLLFSFSILTLVPGFGVINSSHVEAGFRSVDRKFFVPKVVCFLLCATSLDWKVSCQTLNKGLFVSLDLLPNFRANVILPTRISLSRMEMFTFLHLISMEVSWRLWN
jgi:hypothetical protein